MLQEQQVQKLVQEAIQGNSDSFGQLYDLYSAKVFNFIISRVRHKPLAEDILHTVFLKAWNSLPKYRPNPNAKFSTWLFQIANFTIIDHWRTKKETVELDKLENLAQFALDQKLYENYNFLWKAIDELPEDYATVLHMRFMQDLTIAEAAVAMDKTEVGIRVLQHRALKSLRKILAKNGHETF
jgi:RNA polymerase sigma-70 factor (ECF subfamily)